MTDKPKISKAEREAARKEARARLHEIRADHIKVNDPKCIHVALIIKDRRVDWWPGARHWKAAEVHYHGEVSDFIAWCSEAASTSAAWRSINDIGQQQVARAALSRDAEELLVRFGHITDEFLSLVNEQTDASVLPELNRALVRAQTVNRQVAERLARLARITKPGRSGSF